MAYTPPGLLPYQLFWLFDFARYMLTDAFVFLQELRDRLLRRVTLAPIPVEKQPLVSVVMAGFNEAETMPLTLSSLAEQSWQHLEIVIVDDGSDDGTSARVRSFLEARGWHDDRCRLVTLKRRNGKAAALNLGLRLARGEYIVYVDADTTFDRDSIQEIVRPMLEDPRVGAVGGNIVSRNARRNILTQMQSMEYLLSISIGRRFRSQINMLHVISGAFGAFRRSVVEAVGGHTPTSGNDGDLTLKARRVCDKLVFAHRAMCRTNTPITLKHLVKQRRRWDRNLIKNKLRRHRDLLDPRATGFRLGNALLVLDALVFNLALGLRWPIAFGVTAWMMPWILPKVAVVTYLFYLVGDGCQLLLAQWTQPPRSDSIVAQWIYLPLYPVYKIVFRVIRLYSYIEEFTRQASYADVFAPRHVSLQTLDYDNRGRLKLRQLLLSLVWPFGTRS